MDGRPAGKEPFGGTWRVEGLEGFDREYIELTNPPLVRLVISRGGLVDGTFAFGAQEGELDGRIERPGEGPPRMAFTFEGWEEGDMIHGYGVAALVERPEGRDALPSVGHHPFHVATHAAGGACGEVRRTWITRLRRS